MKGQITYTPTINKSIELSKQSLDSFNRFNGWDITRNKGLTKETWEELAQSRFKYEIFERGRLGSMIRSGDKVLSTKLACVYNNVTFWHKVLEYNEPMVFIEHDIICKTSYLDYDFDEYLIMNIEDAVQGNPKINKPRISAPGDRDKEQIIIKANWGKYFDKIDNMKPGIYDLMDLQEYPLLYYINNEWKRYPMVPGTACYGLTPKGAEKLIYTAKTYGLDQSDFIVNCHNVGVQYVLPSPVKFNSIYLNTSQIPGDNVE